MAATLQPSPASDTSTTTAAIDTSTADFIVMTIAWNDQFGGSLNTPTDSKSNSWTQIGSCATGNNKVTAYYSVPSSVGGSHTFTSTHTVFGRMKVAVEAFSGAASATPISNYACAVNAGIFPASTFQVGSVAPTATDWFVASQITQPAGGSTPTGVAIDSSFTEQFEATPVSDVFGSVSTKESGSSENPTWTYSPSGYWPAVFAFTVAVKASGGGATRGLFRTPPVSGIGVGGSFFRDPLQFAWVGTFAVAIVAAVLWGSVKIGTSVEDGYYWWKDRRYHYANHREQQTVERLKAENEQAALSVVERVRRG